MVAEKVEKRKTEGGAGEGGDASVGTLPVTSETAVSELTVGGEGQGSGGGLESVCGGGAQGDHCFTPPPSIEGAFAFLG